jgi:uncharacterized spore protein YtfJ
MRSAQARLRLRNHQRLMADADEVRAAVARDAASDDIVAHVGERVALALGASAVFGEPVVAGDVTVIPVAKASFGFGGGSGSEDEKRGAGGGGGGSVAPIGFIEIRAGQARFVRIGDGLGPTALRLAWAVRIASRVVRRARAR